MTTEFVDEVQAEDAAAKDHSVTHQLDQIGRVALRAVMREMGERKRAADERITLMQKAHDSAWEQRILELTAALGIEIPEGWEVAPSPDWTALVVRRPLGPQTA